MAAALLASAGATQAASSINLDFSGSGNTLAATGFDGVYNLDGAGFNVSGGRLSIQTLPGDIFGRYETNLDPDDAKNVFWSSLTPGLGTIVDAKVSYTGLTANFHGGGIWLGTDTDHYIRLGVIHNSFEGGLVVEALRENEDLWTERGGPGGDIFGTASPKLADSGAPIEVFLRLVRDGSTATAFYSLDGVSYNQVGGVFNAIAYEQTPGSTVEDSLFRVGVYAFGGGNPTATASFDYFTATVVPEPGSLALLAAGLVAAAAWRRKLS
jgi:cytochrome c